MRDAHPVPGSQGSQRDRHGDSGAVLRRVPAQKAEMGAFPEEAAGACFGWQGPKLLDLSPLQQTMSPDLCHIRCARPWSAVLRACRLLGPP